MAIELPESANEVVQRAKTDVQREVAESNPFLKNSWIGAIITGYANRVYDFYIQLKEAIKQYIPDTATEQNLERWAAIWGINRNPATAANGNVVATGTVSTTIPAGTNFVSSDGVVYQSDNAAVITATVQGITSITRSGSTATVTTDTDHGLANNVPVTIIGANEPEYNVTDTAIQVTALNQFTYQVAGTPASPATGTITASHTSIPVPITAQTFGVDTNQVDGTELDLQSPISGVDSSATVDFGEIGGGTDQETDAAMRTRMLDRIQNPVAQFNVAQIVATAKTVAGVTRVFVEEITPGVGQVTIYFMRDNDDNPIPSAAEVAAVDAVIQAIRPANTDEADVIVSAPTAVSTNFTFTSLSPDTSTMRDAISANLEQFFDENTEVGTNVDQDAYRSAIYNTVDPITGDVMQSFVLSAPSGDIVITSGQIATLGNITYP